MLWFVLVGSGVAQAQEDISGALVSKGKPVWEPKGKALEGYARAEIKRGTESWAEAVTLYVETLASQPGCGKCLQGLGRSLTGGKRFDEAVKVGDFLAGLYPERKEGSYIAALAQSKARHPAEAIPAWDKFLVIDPASVIGWNLRNQAYLRLEQEEEATKVLSTQTKLTDGDVACFKTQISLGNGEVDDARLSFPKCDESGDVDVQRTVEGWLLLQEGKASEAQSKLAQGGGEEDTRLALALARLSEGKYEQAVNLTTKLVQDSGWALDAELAHARALAGQGKAEEAIAALDKRLTAPGWEDQHPKYTRNDVILFLASLHRSKDVCKEALALKLQLLSAKGDAAGAEALRAAAVKVHGESPLFPAPAAPAPVEVAAPAPKGK